MGFRMLVAATAAACLLGSPALADEASLQKQIDELKGQVELQKDIEEIRRLQFAYNYYNSSGMAKQVVGLVSPNAESLEIGGRGVYKGKAGFLRLFGGRNNGVPQDRTGDNFGNVLFQLAGMDVITVSPDRTRAWGRVRVLTPIFRGWPKAKPRFNGGDYEMEYVKENGRWMIYKFKYIHAFSVTFEPDGTVSAGYSTAPKGDADAPTTWYHPWPESGVLPFHFTNPITGEKAPEVTGTTKYWIGNWPGEYGKMGNRGMPPGYKPLPTNPAAE